MRTDRLTLRGTKTTTLFCLVFPLIYPLKPPFHILLKLLLHKTPLQLPRLIPNLLREAPATHQNYLSASMMYNILQGRYSYSSDRIFNTCYIQAHSIFHVLSQCLIDIHFWGHCIFMEHCTICYVDP